MFLNFQGLDLESIRRIAAAMAIAFGGLGPAIAIGVGVRAENAVRTTMIIGLGLAEAVAIYCFVVALIIAFV
jgi:F-type H+-transporting ATPase subunit c